MLRVPAHQVQSLQNFPRWITRDRNRAFLTEYHTIFFWQASSALKNESRHLIPFSFKSQTSKFFKSTHSQNHSHVIPHSFSLFLPALCCFPWRKTKVAKLHWSFHRAFQTPPPLTPETISLSLPPPHPHAASLHSLPLHLVSLLHCKAKQASH